MISHDGEIAIEFRIDDRSIITHHVIRISLDLNKMLIQMRFAHNTSLTTRRRGVGTFRHTTETTVTDIKMVGDELVSLDYDSHYYSLTLGKTQIQFSILQDPTMKSNRSC